MANITKLIEQLEAAGVDVTMQHSGLTAWNIFDTIESWAEDLESEAARDGFEEGRDEAFDDGYDAGREAGHSDGYDEGYSEGHSDGKAFGYDAGHDDGYDAGIGVCSE